MQDELVNFSENLKLTRIGLLQEIQMGALNQAGTCFKKPDIDISCLEGNLHVAFRYLGSGSKKTTTYDFDNVGVTGN